MKKYHIVILLISINLFFTGFCYAADYPSLPTIFINTKYEEPINGNIFLVKTSAEFQNALNSSKLGDIIELQAGNVFTGPFTLPNKTSGTGWVYIKSSDYNNLPSPCTRVSPYDAVNMPKIVVTDGNGGTINTSTNAHHYRFVGIEFRPITGKFVYNIIQIGNGETTGNTLPNNLIFDRCYIHGDSIAGSRRGVMMNGAYISVIDSYVSDCKESGADSQALSAWSTTGPIKIVNNYLEGAGENIIFGGADPSIPNAVASDIEIRCNYIFKPLKWMGTPWTVKNLFELKNARRVLVEGNRLENNWPNGQSGFALLLTPRNQNNTAPWSAVQDIIIRFNTFINIAQGINILGFDAPNKSERTSRVLFQNNVLNVTNLGTGGDGRMFQLLGGPTDVIFDHNTGFCTNAYMVVESNPKIDFFEFRNNIVSYAAYGFIGTGTANANTTLNAYFNPNWVITKNVVIGGSATNYPIGSYFPKNNTEVDFLDFARGNYRLTSSSPYKGIGTDEKDLGADLDSIALMSNYSCDDIYASEIETEYLKDNLSIYPNPSSDFINLALENYTGLIQIFNPLGIEVMETYFQEKINICTLNKGIYFLKVGDKVYKFVKL